jgi:hypothetical protein
LIPFLPIKEQFKFFDQSVGGNCRKWCWQTKNPFGVVVKANVSRRII